MVDRDQGPAEASLDSDLAALNEGRPLERHEWLQGILDDPNIGPNAYGQNPPRDVVLRVMLERMKELSRMPVRDIELEKATVELGRLFTSGPLYDGGSAVFEWVRATEVYEDLRTDMQVYHKANPQIVRSEIVGIGGIYAGYTLGENIDGLRDEFPDRWFMSFRASEIHVHVPFDAITEVVDGSSQIRRRTFNGKESVGHYGAVIESPNDRSGMFNAWIQREVA